MGDLFELARTCPANARPSKPKAQQTQGFEPAAAGVSPLPEDAGTAAPAAVAAMP